MSYTHTQGTQGEGCRLVPPCGRHPIVLSSTLFRMTWKPVVEGMTSQTLHEHTHTPCQQGERRRRTDVQQDNKADLGKGPRLSLHQHTHMHDMIALHVATAEGGKARTAEARLKRLYSMPAALACSSGRRERSTYFVFKGTGAGRGVGVTAGRGALGGSSMRWRPGARPAFTRLQSCWRPWLKPRALRPTSPLTPATSPPAPCCPPSEYERSTCGCARWRRARACRRCPSRAPSLLTIMLVRGRAFLLRARGGTRTRATCCDTERESPRAACGARPPHIPRAEI